MKKLNKSKVDTTNMEAVEVYKLVIAKTIGKFPNGFWLRPEATDNAIKVTKYLLEITLQWTFEDIQSKFDFKILRANKLAAMCVIVFNGSPFSCIDAVYPNKFKQWQFTVPTGFWNEDTALKATKWMLEEKLKWNKDTIKKNYSRATFKKEGLQSPLDTLFNGSPYTLLNKLYPDQYRITDLANVTCLFWNKENCAIEIKHLLEEKLQLTDEQIKQTFCIKFLETHGLGTLSDLFESSPYKILDYVYPNKFKPWEFKRVPKNYWDKENIHAVEAIKWMVNKLQYDEADLKAKVTVATFRENNLRGMLSICYGDSVRKALENAYPTI